MYFYKYRAVAMPHRCFWNFCDDTSGRNVKLCVKLRDHYGLVKISLTIYRHKMENRNPKKKSSGKNIFFTKVPRQEKRK